jgi:hypothetical protein
MAPLSNDPIAADVLMSAILDVFTPAQVIKLVDEIRQLKAFGFGRITLVINCGKLRLIQAEKSYDFREGDQLT